MDTAERFAELSSAKRLQVGAIITKGERIISIGYNGTPSGWDNNCETKDYMSPDAGGWIEPEILEERYPFEDEKGRYTLKTRPEVLHAESNAIAKLAKTHESGDGASIFVTHSPCMDCAKMIYQSGITHVYYKHDYRSSDGVDFLKQCGITIEKLDP